MNVFCEQGWLKAFAALIASNGVARIRLFQNNYIPLFTDTIAVYTEANFSGYVGFQNLAWGAPFVNGSNEGEIDATQAIWTHNGGGITNLVYGVYISDNLDVLTYAERFDAPITMALLADVIKYTPRSTVVNQ